MTYKEKTKLSEQQLGLCLDTARIIVNFGFSEKNAVDRMAKSVALVEQLETLKKLLEEKR